MLRAFNDALSVAIAERRRSLAADPNAPRDMLGAMLAAVDPETGERLTEAGSARQRHDLHLWRTGDDVECADVGDLLALAITRMARAGSSRKLTTLSTALREMRSRR